jgi:hypothetical protein
MCLGAPLVCRCGLVVTCLPNGGFELNRNVMKGLRN